MEEIKKIFLDSKKKIEIKKFSNLKKAWIAIMKDIKIDNIKKIVLFSPAAASFDNFKNFEDRGKYFNRLIKNIKVFNKFFDYFSYYKWWKNLDKFILSLIITFFIIGLFFS